MSKSELNPSTPTAQPSQVWPGRPLTELEQQFVREANDGFFAVLRSDEDGHPYAMGAPHTGNLFSMPVIEIDDPHNDGSIYELEGE